MTKYRTCGIEGCERKHHARGLCSKHYQRFQSGSLPEWHRNPPAIIEHCGIDGCDRKHLARGLCNKHYLAFRTGKLPGRPWSPKTWVPKSCGFEGCENHAVCKGFCNGHYQQYRVCKQLTELRSARPFGMDLQEIVEHVLSNTVRTESGCLEWQGSRTAYGYGEISFGGRARRTHRLVYEAKVGAILPGMVVRHACDNRPCVNPEHLICGTQGDNVKDKTLRGRARRKLSPEQVSAIRERRSNGETLSRIAADFKIDQSMVALIHKRKSWAWLEYES